LNLSQVTFIVVDENVKEREKIEEERERGRGRERVRRRRRREREGVRGREREEREGGRVREELIAFLLKRANAKVSSINHIDPGLDHDEFSIFGIWSHKVHFFPKHDKTSKKLRKTLCEILTKRQFYRAFHRLGQAKNNNGYMYKCSKLTRK